MNDDRPGTVPPVRVQAPRLTMESTFASFCRAELRAVVAFLMKIGATFEEAQDAAQEAMIEAWANWGSLSEPGNHPRAWVRKVAQRAFLRSVPKRDLLRHELPDGLCAAAAEIALSDRTQIKHVDLLVSRLLFDAGTEDLRNLRTGLAMRRLSWEEADALIETVLQRVERVVRRKAGRVGYEVGWANAQVAADELKNLRHAVRKLFDDADDESFHCPTK